MKRYAITTRLLPGKLAEYARLHEAVWPGVLETIKQCNIHTFSIHTVRLPDGHDYLFGYFEYLGDDYEADMQKMAADEETQRWWAVCKPMMQPVSDLPPGEVWTPLEEVFYCQ